MGLCIDIVHRMRIGLDPTEDTAVVFHDSKEGRFAIRVADWLREKWSLNFKEVL